MLSTLTGIVMLVFLLGALTDRILTAFDLNLGGFSLSFTIHSLELLIPLTAGITVLGFYHILRIGLGVSGRQCVLYLILPFAVVLTIGFALRNMSGMKSVCVALSLGGALLYLVLYFEYNACDPGFAGTPIAVAVLSGLCYAVFLLFVMALRATVSRLIISLPAVFLLGTVISMKLYSFALIRSIVLAAAWHMKKALIRSSVPLTAAVTGIVMTFAAAGLHYWPIDVISYGALMFLWYYCFISLEKGADNRIPTRRILLNILPAAVPVLAVMAVLRFTIL